MRETWVQSLGWEDSSGEGNGNPLQYSCLENPMDGRAWWATVHRFAKSRTWLSDFTSLHVDYDLFSHLLFSLLFTFTFVFLSAITDIKDFFHFLLYTCFQLEWLCTNHSLDSYLSPSLHYLEPRSNTHLYMVPFGTESFSLSISLLSFRIPAFKWMKI